MAKNRSANGWNATLARKQLRALVGEPRSTAAIPARMAESVGAAEDLRQTRYAVELHRSAHEALTRDSAKLEQVRSLWHLYEVGVLSPGDVMSGLRNVFQ